MSTTVTATAPIATPTPSTAPSAVATSAINAPQETVVNDEKKFGTPLHIREHIRQLWETVKREVIQRAPRQLADFYADGPAPAAEAAVIDTEAEPAVNKETGDVVTAATEDDWIDTRATAVAATQAPATAATTEAAPSA